MFQSQNRETINSTWKVVVSFEIIMTTNVTRPCSTTQHQTCKTKTKTETDFLVRDRSCPKTNGLIPHRWTVPRTTHRSPARVCLVKRFSLERRRIWGEAYRVSAPFGTETISWNFSEAVFILWSNCFIARQHAMHTKRDSVVAVPSVCPMPVLCLIECIISSHGFGDLIGASF